MDSSGKPLSYPGGSPGVQFSSGFLRLRACHFNFRAMESVYFPPGKAGNVLRGALGTTLPFEDLSAPPPGRPRGLADPPRPFVFRATHLDGKRFQPGETFSIGVNIFDLRRPLLDIFLSAFSESDRAGGAWS
jgi:hypothetical protein